MWKFPFLLISGWLHNAQDQRFQLTQVFVAERQIDAKAIPRFLMSIP